MPRRSYKSKSIMVDDDNALHVRVEVEATAFLLDVLKSNLPEHGYLQTKVLLFSLL